MTEPSARTLEQMQNLAERLSANPDYMASVLTAYKKLEHISDARLLEILDTTPDKLCRLALCKRPNSQEARFSDDVRQLALYTSIDPLRLAVLIRQVESLVTFAAMPKRIEPLASNQGVSKSAGVLTAARDRSEEYEPASPSQETKDDSESENGDQT